jgi:hypothetical protein
MEKCLNFCTLFDANYLPRALVLYHSLVDNAENFRLYVVCMDELAYEILEKLNLSKLVAIKLNNFESPDLLKIKGHRTDAEYCWTCTPHVIWYVLEQYKLEVITYLDADLCFYANPSILLNEFELSGASILLTEHRYSPCYDQTLTSGIYCVQFMSFKADSHGLLALKWWQDRCLEWCYARFEDGKFGDQKYLDDWKQRFEGVHVLQNIGGGVAPWNIQQYHLKNEAKGLYVNDALLIFYHFHAYRYYRNHVHAFSPNYKISKEAQNYLYHPYALSLLMAYDEIQKIKPDFFHGFSRRDNLIIEIAKMAKRKILGVCNEYKIY